jgi:hypothetical protein
MRFLAVSSSSADIDVIASLPLSADEPPPRRVFVIGQATHALRRAALAAGTQADERWLDDAGAYVLEERAGPPPERPRPLKLLERVVGVADGAHDDDRGGFETSPRGVELLGAMVMMAAPSIDAVDDDALFNAHIWIVGGDELPRLEQRDEGRLVLGPGDLFGGGGVLDLRFRRGSLTATVTRDGEELATLTHQLRTSTKMSVQG